MANTLFDSLGKKQAPQAMNPVQMLASLKSNPAQFLQSRGFEIPNGMNNPQQIIQHLLQSGQVSPSRYQQIINRR